MSILKLNERDFVNALKPQKVFRFQPNMNVSTLNSFMVSSHNALVIRMQRIVEGTI